MAMSPGIVIAFLPPNKLEGMAPRSASTLGGSDRLGAGTHAAGAAWRGPIGGDSERDTDPTLAPGAGDVTAGVWGPQKCLVIGQVAGRGE